MTWIRAGTKGPSCGQSLAYTKLWASSNRSRSHRAHSPATRPAVPACHSFSGVGLLSTATGTRTNNNAVDRDVIRSVLEASATRRDAKGYLQKYASKTPEAVSETPEFVQGKHQHQGMPPKGDPVPVAIAKLRDPQNLDEETLRGVAKTITQLRVLGLVSLVIVDCGLEEGRDVYEDQAFRIGEAIDSIGQPLAMLVSNIFIRQAYNNSPKSSLASGSLEVDDAGLLGRILQRGKIPVIPALASPDELSSTKPVDAHAVVMALTKYLTGLQFKNTDDGLFGDGSQDPQRPPKIATVERIVLLDPLGGTPVVGGPGASHRFVNLEQEYVMLLKHLMGPEGSLVESTDQAAGPAAAHVANLKLAKDALAILPSSSSALITTPWAVANITPRSATLPPASLDGQIPLEVMVQTRRKQNPLLYNFLTEKPVYSSSLPVQRVHGGDHESSYAQAASATTLVKRGMPLTIFPNPHNSPWSPPAATSHRLRLTDNCIDLPRLVHLIEDSFDRKLDVQHYLERVNDNLAGVIIAGEYEGGAILTWECPDGLSYKAAYESGRLVPYLDKFAVLKSRQGSGGVADIVVNAMVQSCFPGGVCWRSRKNNPVNKWYFERSTGTKKLSNSNWTMFWTTLNLDGQHPTLRDYEAVCRGVEPSWADNKHILD